ncbi:12901_t:CDS:1, partial [Dentiscutata erythropus]
TLEHLDCNRNSTSVEQFAKQWGLEIGTVVEYTKHIVTAINSIRNTYIQWPDSIERQQISSRIEHLSGFKGCVGFLNKTDFVLEYKPLKDEETYYNKKKKYALTVQLICDELKFIQFANF